jgi:NAD-dependent deacetylase
MRRAQLKDVEPNLAHKIIAELENDFDVTVVTQNVDNLHERAGSTNVIHLHGELTKVRSTLNPSLIYDWIEDCNVGDKCEKGSQLRPHVVWFGENLDPKNIDLATEVAMDCDFCIIVGTSMQVAPANQIPFLTKSNTLIYVIDPSDMDFYIDKQRKPFLNHIKDVASVGMQKVKQELLEIINK